MAFSEEEMLRDLDAADAAGDTQLATHIAGLIKAQRSAAPSEAKALDTFRAGERATLPDAPQTTGEKALSAAKWVAQQPVNLVGGLKRSMGDTALGLRQFAANTMGTEDPEQLRQQAMMAESEARNLPAGNTAGKVVGDIASLMIPGGAAAKVGMLPRAAAFAEKAAPYVGKLIPSLFGSAAGGAASTILAPETGDYNLGERALTGAEWGAGGNVAGRIAGRAMAPFRKPGSAAAQENAAILNEGGLPNAIPATQTDSPMLQAATNALEQVPVLGRLVTKAREGNLDWLTRRATAETGKEVSQLTPKVRQEMVDQLNAMGNRFRTQERIPLDEVSTKASAAADRVRDYAEATSQMGKLKKLENAATATSPAQLKAPYSRATSGMPTPTISKTPTADEVMDLRRAAGEMAFKESDPVLAQQYRALRDSYDEALRNKFGPDKGAEFDKWRQQWGALEDVKKAAEKGMQGGRLRAEALASTVPDTFAPKTANQKLFTAAAENMPSPPEGWNRAMITAALLGGAPAAGGVASDVVRGDPGWGTASGGALSAAMISGLVRKKPDQATIDAVRRFMTAAALAGGNQMQRGQ